MGAAPRWCWSTAPAHPRPSSTGCPALPDGVHGIALDQRGFGGTRDVDGTPCWTDPAGSGGGTDDPALHRNVLRAFYVAPDHVSADEQGLLDPHLWPGTAPGPTGTNTAISPRYVDVSSFAEVPTHPPVTWVRGSVDLIVSDTSKHRLGHLGAIGAVPGWPGEDVSPAHPMNGQLRAVLDRYTGNGSSYQEVELEGIGHSPHLEARERFLELVFGAIGHAAKPTG